MSLEPITRALVKATDALASVQDAPALPGIAVKGAKLPEVYRRAVDALSKCQRVDECKTWRDKAIALASYARQARDPTLLNTAAHIQFRAERQMGKLLQAIGKTKAGAPRKTQRNNSGRGRTELSQRNKAAREAGVSERQQKRALLVAGIPEDVFNELVQREKPPTPAEIKALGGTVATSVAVARKRDRARAGFDDAEELRFGLRARALADLKALDLPLAVSWSMAGENGEGPALIALAEEWLDFITRLLALCGAGALHELTIKGGVNGRVLQPEEAPGRTVVSL